MLLNKSRLNTVVLNGAGSGVATISASGTGRFVSDEEFNRITSDNYEVFSRVRIADPAGKMQEYANRDGYNWIESVEWQEDVNQPIAQATVKLFREINGRSLAPLRTNSSLNKVPYPEPVLDTFGNTVIAYGPSIDAGRRITIDVACPPLGTDPNAVDPSAWHTVFDGYIDSVDWAQNPMPIEARDLGALVQDTYYLAPQTLTFPEVPLPLIDIIAVLIGLGHADITNDLYVPDLEPTLDTIIGAFKYDAEPVMDVLQRVVQQVGFDLRFTWAEPFQQFRLTLKNPGRNKTTPDYELPPSAYIDIKQAKIDVLGIRNDITVTFRPDNNLGTPRATLNIFDAESVRRYHRRSMIVQEADDSPVNSVDSANLMANLILFDLSRPVADQVVEMPLAWFVELFDFIRFTPNGVTHDDPLDLGVINVKHSISNQGNRTTLEGRGRPASGYWGWLTRRPTAGGNAKPTDPDGTPTPNLFSSLKQVPDYAANTIEFDWVWGGDASATFEVWVQHGSIGFSKVHTTAALANSYTYTPSADIEPFRTPPDSPQIGIEIDFFLRAIVGGVAVATSAICYGSYGDGP